MLTVYHGGNFDSDGSRLWTSVDPEYAAGYAQLHEGDLWALTVEIADAEILDVSGCELDAAAVASSLTAAGLPAQCREDEHQHPQSVVRRVSDEAIRAAGFRAVRLCEWIDWGHQSTGTVVRRAVSLCLVDLDAIVHRETVSMPEGNFHVP